MTDDPPGGPLAWATMVVICACAVLSGLLEVLFVPLYVGSVIVPVAVVAALAGNVVLPRWGLQALHRGIGGALPALCWLVTVLGLATVPRPEGDVLVAGGNAQAYVFYGVLLAGAVAAMVTVVAGTSAPPAPAARAPRPPAPRARGRRLSG